MRRVMETLEDCTPIFIGGRKRPYYYEAKAGSLRVLVVGHYDSQCGGGDTIGSARAIFDMIKELQSKPENAGATILCEGLLLSEDTKWTSQMKNPKVYFLTTPLETCLKQIKSRRLEVGNDKPLNPANTENRVGVIERARGKLESLGVWCRRCPPNQCVKLIIDRLRRSGKENTNAR